ncbi:phage major capsid protein [Microbacterium trichothecenolyticum]|uniref:phage major capsid protein n=1 Tax=Microbacterium trichothecenolyticum TaxID=69370 RepID=UPI001C6F2BAA|nr:phage major capsid protein [Microbacterium trichothecenolyticum]MBW9118880.1 phage major capsid protein [Microbacterium trichothecenolyticum]
MDYKKMIADALRRKAAIEAERSGYIAAQRAIVDGLGDDEALTDEQRGQVAALTAQKRTATERIDAIDAEISSLRAEQADDERLTRGAQERHEQQPVPAARVTSEPETYRKGGQNSFFRDLYNAQVRGKTEAFERLERHNQERAISTTDGAGGEFVPPLWMVNDYIALARAGRVLANQLEPHDLPAGTDSISIPTVATGTATAAQATQNSALQETDLTTSSVTAQVETIGGVQTVSVQLIEQSPVNIDDIVIADLATDLAVKIDTFAISNNATNKVGLLNVSGLNAVTYTDASPTVQELLPKIIAGSVAIGRNRKLPAEKVFMTPEMWGWIIASQDTQGRPLVVPTGFGASNAQGIAEGAVAEGLAGYITSLSLPVYIDGNLPTNLGAGTNEHHTLVARTSDIHLYESAPKAEAFRETAAKNLGVVFRLYEYVAIHAGRYPKSIAKIAGTGTIVPAL